MIWEDYYKTLQVHYLAEQEVIEASYKRLSKKYHPDLRSGRYAEDKMKRLNAAYEVLGNQEKRRAYHAQWMKVQANGSRDAALVLDTEAVQDKQGYDEAFAVLDAYFQDLMHARYGKAYSRLTTRNRKEISLEEFTKWQEAVSGVFALGSYWIQFYREHEPLTVGEVYYQRVREYGVDISDKCLKTGKVSRESMTKCVAFEEGAWFVYLGYEDLKTLTYKFQCLKDALGAINQEEAFIQMLLKRDSLTGLPSRAGFLEKAKVEAERSNRYGSIFSIVVLELMFQENGGIVLQREDMNHATIQAAGIVQASLRATDIAGRWGENRWILLFPETDRKSACFAIEKLYTRFVAQGVCKTFIHAGIAQYFNEDLSASIQKAAFHCSYSKIRREKGSSLTIISSLHYHSASNHLKSDHFHKIHSTARKKTFRNF